MQSYQIDKNSWHFKLIGGVNSTWYKRYYYRNGDLVYSQPPDICSYRKQVILSLLSWFFKLAIAITIWTAVSMSVYDKIVGNPYALIISIFFPLFVILFLVLVILLVGCVSYGLRWLRDRYEERRGPAKPKAKGFISTAYDSLRQKYCVPVSFKEDTE